MPHVPSAFSCALYAQCLTNFYMPHTAVHVTGSLCLQQQQAVIDVHSEGSTTILALEKSDHGGSDEMIV